MDRTRWHLSVYHAPYHASYHVPYRRFGVARFAGVPVPWFVRRCRTCGTAWPCAPILGAHPSSPRFIPIQTSRS
ncbi:hypothetical protein AB0I28_05620 [Phytomonospora sp. NPDC050363]|uniref:hypothetical protein n=1 Tax=Phytomonospora sp. NPDC050363 TaxID=3155642 RepID=UPI0033DF73BD